MRDRNLIFVLLSIELGEDRPRERERERKRLHFCVNLFAPIDEKGNRSAGVLIARFNIAGTTSNDASKGFIAFQSLS